MCHSLIGRKDILASKESIDGHIALSMSTQIETNTTDSDFLPGLVNNHLFNLQIKPGTTTCSIVLGGVNCGIRLYSNSAYDCLFVQKTEEGDLISSICATLPPPSEELLVYFTSYWGFNNRHATLPALRNSIGIPVPSFAIYENLVKVYKLYDKKELKKLKVFDIRVGDYVPWNESECITAVSLLVASHRESLFKVMNGNVYINNLLCHFKDFKSIRDVTASCRELKPFLDRITVPYLGPTVWGQHLVDVFPSMFGKLNRFDESDYKKFYFEVFVNGTPLVCIVDCIPSDEALEDGLQALIEKSYQNARNVKSTCALHLVFCFDNCLFECYKEKQALQRYISGKRCGVFLAKFIDGIELIPLYRDPFQFDSVTIVIPIYSELFA